MRRTYTSTPQIRHEIGKIVLPKRKKSSRSLPPEVQALLVKDDSSDDDDEDEDSEQADAEEIELISFDFGDHTYARPAPVFNIFGDHDYAAAPTVQN